MHARLSRLAAIEMAALIYEQDSALRAIFTKRFF